MNISMAIIALFFSWNVSANSQQDMFKICSTDDGTLDNIDIFPIWHSEPDSALFTSFNNLTTNFGFSHSTCSRTTTVEDNLFDNSGINCDFIPKSVDWALRLHGQIAGKFEIKDGVELSSFQQGQAPTFEIMGGALKFELTRLCRRKINGTLTNEIILESLSSGGHYQYLILDTAL